jgi:hypothetical protein
MKHKISETKQNEVEYGDRGVKHNLTGSLGNSNFE